MNAISMRNLTKEYKNFALKNVNLEVESGTVMGLIGENGAGKTTLIKCILNLVRYQGEIDVLGGPLSVKTKENIGVVLSDGFFPQTVNVKDVDKILAKAYSNWDSAYFYYFIDRFKIKSERLYNMSTGNRMKLKIAAALAHRPKLLLLDEPTAGLDPVIRDEILDFFFEFIEKEDHTVLFSSHILSDLEKVADSITFVHDGEIVFSQNKEEMLYNLGILRTTEEELPSFDQSCFIKRRKNKYSVDVLIHSREEFAQRYPKAVVDHPSIEDVMVFYGRGE